MGISKIQQIILIFFSLVLMACNGPISAWTGQTYSGTITKDSMKRVYMKFIGGEKKYEYYDQYDIGCAGNWTIEIKSLDNINLLIDVKTLGCEQSEPSDCDLNINDVIITTGTSDKISFTHKFDAGFRILIKVTENDANWIKNGKQAEYTIKATLN